MALDRVALIVKIGDRIVAPSKEWLGEKEGTIGGWIDEQDWGDTLENIISANMHRVYGIVQVDRKMIPKLAEWVKPIGETNIEGVTTRDKSIYRPAQRILQLPDLITKVSNPDVTIEKLRGVNDVVPLINGLMLTENDFTDSSTLNNSRQIPDLNAVSSGSYTVGSGGDYTTWKSAHDDTADPLTGDLTFTQTSDVTETAKANMWDALGGNTLRCTSDSDHQGNPNSGHITTLNHTDKGWDVENEGAGTLEIDHLYFKQIQNTTSVWYGCLDMNTVVTALTMKVHDCMFDGQSDNMGIAMAVNDGDITLLAYNNKMWEQDKANMRTLTCSSSSIVENNTAITADNGFMCQSTNMIFRNNVSYNHSNDDWNSASSSFGYNNASEDTSGEDADFQTGSSGNITGIVAGDWISVTDTSDDFLAIDDTSSLYDVGDEVTISGHTEYINGITIVANSEDIGCNGVDEFSGHPWYYRTGFNSQ